jgi:nucleoside-diphosphate-sugar epimerase
MSRSDYSAPVFLTGATGFIGRRLTQALLDLGCTLSALVLPSDAQALPEGVRPYPGDVTDPGTLANALADVRPTVVFHLAAIGMTNPSLPMGAACRVNVDGVINILDAVHSVGGVQRVVLVGSSYEYGARRSDDELDPFNPYGASKVAAWAFARAAYNAWGLPVVWVRPFQVFGPGQHSKALVPASILAAIGQDDFQMTRGEQQRDFVFVSDVVEGLLAAGRVPDIEGRVLDLGSGQLRSVRQVVERIWSLAGAEGRVLAGALPYRPGEVPAIPANVQRTRLLTGWEALTSLDEGLMLTIDAFRNECSSRRERDEDCETARSWSQESRTEVRRSQLGDGDCEITRPLEDDHVE